MLATVENSLHGGVSIVQYRDKTSDTGQLVETAKKLQTITARYKVPLLINDRVDVALAMGADGVHIGQDDIDLSTARKLLGKHKIIGVSVTSVNEAIEAAKGGANYLGGMLRDSPNLALANSEKELRECKLIDWNYRKADAKAAIGIKGAVEILIELRNRSYDIPAVGIGGLNHENLKSVMHVFSPDQVPYPDSRAITLAGAAVVSAIMGASNPEHAARSLASIMELGGQNSWPNSHIGDTECVLNMISRVRSEKPLSHNMMNYVVQNFAANVALAIGASPIMAGYGPEAEELSRLDGALVINMGSVDPEGLDNYEIAIKAYNDAKRPVLFDPVGAGANQFRRGGAARLIRPGRFAVIKGNEGEILQLAGTASSQQKGVDSGPSNHNNVVKAKIVHEFAQRYKSIVVMTGKTDIVSNGTRCFRVDNGHELLDEITGAGCTLGTTISACLAVSNEGCRLEATLSAMLLFEVAAELAAELADGPGTFVPLFLDKLSQLSKNPEQIVEMTRIQEIEL
ncbi:MAG: hypothetical protein M1814_006746 [Vezdaea aestivalis]|nr:MAG: hypothetical protein M1814_006746 [Vezdaea aestivalis]